MKMEAANQTIEPMALATNISLDVNATNITNVTNVTSAILWNNAYDYSYRNYTNEYATNSTMARWIIQRLFLPAICSIGILGIFLTIVVLSRKSMCTSTNCYLMALSIADLLFLLLLASILIDERFAPDSSSYYHFVIYVTHTAIFMQIFQLASVWLTVMLAVERYIAICKPFLANKFCTVFRARVIICIIFALALICRCPNFWENKIVTVRDSMSNTSWTYMEPTDLSEDVNYITLYPWIIEGVVTSMLPFLLLVILNIRLIWEVRKSTQYLKRNQLLLHSDNSLILIKEEQQITFMLISIVIVFFLCQAPYVIYTAYVSINKFVAHSHHILLFRDVTILMLTLKSAVNFILYCWFSEKFLTALKGVVRKCSILKKKRRPSINNRRESLFSRQYTSTSTRDTYI